MMASTSAPAGIDSDPTRRQRPPTRPIRAAAVVAAPESRARKARGSLVTRSCYPARLPAGVGRSATRSGVPGDLVVRLLETGDEQLDAGVVGQDLAGGGEVAAEDATQDGIEEEHRVGAERPVRPAGLEEVDGRTGQAAQLDLAGDLLDELVALLLGGFVRTCSCRSTDGRLAGLGRVELVAERLVGGRSAQGEDDVLDRSGCRRAPRGRSRR